jgi:hypothetical protein
MQSGKYGVDLVVDGNVISERADGVVAVPFGRDYAIRLRNDDSRRAVAVIYIDGINVSYDGFVVSGRSNWTIHRPADKAVTFRVASSQSTAAVEHGKAGEDTNGEKGLIRVEWRAELYRREPQGFVMKDGAFDIKLLDFNPHVSCSMGMNSTDGLELCSRRIVVNDVPKATETLSTAVTVEGQASSQKFVGVQVGPLETSATVIQLKLKGYEASQGVPITGTNYCPQCRARTAKPTDRYCRNCGASLSTRSSLGKPH